MGELFNTKENELINRIKKMKPLCRGVLVVERFKKSWYANVPEDAWYALDQRKDMTVKIDGYTAPLITVTEANKHFVDVEACCRYCGVQYSYII